MYPPITTFSDRGQAVARALALVAGPQLTKALKLTALAKADQEVTSALERMDQEVTGLSGEQLEAVGADWANGQAKATAVKNAVTAPALGQERYNRVRRGARLALTANADKPEWTIAALIDAARPVVAKTLNQRATEAVASLEDLPNSAVKFLQHSRPQYLDQLVEAQTPVADIAAYRRARDAWEAINPTSNARDTRLAWEHLAHAMATSTVAPMERGRLKELDNLPSRDNLNGWSRSSALLLNGPGMAAHALGTPLHLVVMERLGTLAPLADPLGADNKELEDRLSQAGRAIEWLGKKIEANNPRLYARNPLGAMDYAVDGLERIQRAGFRNQRQALEAYLSANVWDNA